MAFTCRDYEKLYVYVSKLRFRFLRKRHNFFFVITYPKKYVTLVVATVAPMEAMNTKKDLIILFLSLSLSLFRLDFFKEDLCFFQN